MKMVKMSILAAALALSTSAAQAYYTNGAYVGTATVSLSGACSFKKLTFKDAKFGHIYDENDGDVQVGWGILTADNQIVTLYTGDYSYILYKWTNKSWKGTGTYFEDYLSEPLVDLINGNTICNINSIYPSAKSRIVYKDDYEPGYVNYKGSAALSFGFDGFVDDTYEEDSNGYTYTGGAFTGKVTFKGNYVESAP